jgi:hypothetical protein
LRIPSVGHVSKHFAEVCVAPQLLNVKSHSFSLADFAEFCPNPDGINCPKIAVEPDQISPAGQQSKTSQAIADQTMQYIP